MKLEIFSLCLAASVSAHEGHDHGDNANHDHSADPVESSDPAAITPPAYKASEITAPFIEQFGSPSTIARWTKSSAKKDDEFAFRGEWAFEEPTVWKGLEGDAGLVVKTAAAHHAISAKFDEVIDPKGKGLVVQYEVKFQNQHDCGGAYIKLLTNDDTFNPEEYNDQTPYTIMFGPDKCGNSNKVHFIFRHQNPITKEWEEKSVNAPPAAKIEKKTGLYTLIVKPDNTFEILINNESVKKGSLLEDFTPSVEPPKEIEDESDTKPEDWVDDAKIPDETATKPEDWDEDAPKEIEDESAVMPEDWLVDEEDSVPDPEASIPEDWDVEEDGEWVAPSAANPKCEGVSGCGKWTRPMVPNPEFKGKWRVPMIDNPAYIGVWSRKMVSNPNWFADESPSDFTPMGAIGIELWTMSDGITFDNIYVGHSAEDAQTLATEQWKVKFETEKLYEAAGEKEKAEEKVEGESGDGMSDKAQKLYKQAVDELALIRQMWKRDGPVETIKQFKWIFASAFISIWIFVSTVIGFMRGTAKPVKASAGDKKKNTDTDAGDKKKKTDAEDEEEVEPSVITKKKSSPAAKKRAKKAAKEVEVEEEESE